MGRKPVYATEEERTAARRATALKYYYANRQLKKDPVQRGTGVSYTAEYHQHYAREYYRRKIGKTNPETESTLVSPSECS